MTGWRRRLETSLAEVRQRLVDDINAVRLNDLSPDPAHCDSEQLASLARRLLPIDVETRVHTLLQLEAALCQMEMGLYGLCADCEDPLDPAALDQDPALQRCPRCEARYRKGDHTREL